MSFLILIVILESLLTLLLPNSRGYFFDQLTTKTFIYWGLFYFFLNTFLLDFIQSWKNYFITKHSLIHRECKTQEFTHDTSLIGKIINNLPITNIPQRIQEDIKLMYLNRYTVHVEYWISGVILGGLVVKNYDHYYLLGSAMLFALVSILIMYLFNNRMIHAEKSIQSHEADYRSNLVGRWPNILSLLYEANRATMHATKVKLEYTLFTKLQNAIILILPYLFLLPSYLHGNITLGKLVEMATVFSLLVVNADIVIAQFPLLVQGKACKERVEEIL